MQKYFRNVCLKNTYLQQILITTLTDDFFFHLFMYENKISMGRVKKMMNKGNLKIKIQKEANCEKLCC